ncbi:MAG: hypothetical protein JWP97_3555 [Labilithrix sp.]|nr:hypothetical protein [Labilithrix sp.]
MLPEATTRLLELYRGPLRDVRFPDADEGRLHASIDSMQAAQDALTQAELAVDAARSALRDQTEMVRQQTERAFAYARIYADGRPELREALDAATEATKPARRGPGRPKKASGSGVLPNLAGEQAAE